MRSNLSGQVQQEKRRLCAEAQRATCQSDRLRQEVGALRTRLEETEWGLCQKTGEIALLKSQLKDCQVSSRRAFRIASAPSPLQNDQTAKGHELLQLRSDCRELRESLAARDAEISQLKESNLEKDEEIDKLRREVGELRSFSDRGDEYAETELLKAEIRELREELSDMSLNEYGGIEPGRTQRKEADEEEGEEDGDDEKRCSHRCKEAEELRKDFEAKIKDFEKERKVWAQEKEKVLRYQRQLQMNYVQMYRRTRALEAEVENLTIELELDKTGLKKKLPAGDLTHTIEL